MFVNVTFLAVYSVGKAVHVDLVTMELQSLATIATINHRLRRRVFSLSHQHELFMDLLSGCCLCAFSFAWIMVVNNF